VCSEQVLKSINLLHENFSEFSAEWTLDDRLRNVAFLGLRRDEKSQDVVEET